MAPKFHPQRTHPSPRRRELANQHDVVHGKAGSTHSLSEFAPKPDSASTASASASAASVPVTQTLTLSGSDSRVQIQLAQAAPLPQPPRSILHNPACSGYFIETVSPTIPAVPAVLHRQSRPYLKPQCRPRGCSLSSNRAKSPARYPAPIPNATQRWEIMIGQASHAAAVNGLHLSVLKNPCGPCCFDTLFRNSGFLHTQVQSRRDCILAISPSHRT